MPDPLPPDPSQIIQQSAAPDMSTQGQMPTLAPQPVQGKSKLPGIMGLIANMIHPPTQVSAQPGGLAQARPVSRADQFEQFLGNFMYSLGQGMSQSGHGPGANIRGAGAAMQAPYQRQLMQSQLAEQQAGTQEAQQRAALIGKQAQMAGTMATVTLPGGQIMQVPMNQLGQLTGQVFRGSQAAQTAAQAKMGVAQFQFMISQNKVARLLPSEDGKSYTALNQFGQPLGTVDNVLVKEAMGKTSNTVEWKQDENGVWNALPKTTVTKPNLPGAGGSAPLPNRVPAPSGKSAGTTVPLSQAVRGKVPNMVTGSMPDGTQVAGTPEELRKAGAQNLTKLPEGEASKVTIARQLISPTGLFQLAKNDLAAFKPDELQALGPRWNEFLVGKYGADPRYTKLRTHVNGLLSTALMQAHVGARGGERIMEHFEDLANAGTFDRKNLEAALDAEAEYVKDKAMFVPQAQNNGPRRIIDLTK